ncbi:hypothetical protein AX15_003420 [Amanita polypyramis BW_CC]|nr:hypothetical protein AX15_003420 [Amanita polypyramis BW_CC]
MAHILRLAHTNQQYDVHDAQVICSSMVYAQDALQGIGSDVVGSLRNESDTKASKEQEEKLVVDLAQCEITITTHKELPEDILRHIFTICAWEFGHVRLPMQRSNIPPQVILSHVCSDWRKIALETRHLWSSVEIAPPKRDIAARWMRWMRPQTIGHHEEIYQEWFSRAGNYPMTIILSLDSRSEDYMLSVFRKFVTPVRIRVLKLRATIDQLLLLTRVSEIAPIDTEELDLELPIPFPFPDSPSFADLPHFIHRTRSMTFDGPFLDDTKLLALTMGLQLPWSQLRSLKLTVWMSSLCLSTWIDFLRQTSQLEVCHLKNISVDKEWSALKQLTLPHLREFAIDVGSASIDLVIGHFIFPNLTTLLLSHTEDWTSKTYEIIKHQYNLNRLQHISINPDRCNFIASTLLKDAPNLRTLDLPGVAMDNEAMRGISTGHLGRFLSSMTMVVLLASQIGDTASILDMLETRQKRMMEIVESGRSWKDQISSLRTVKLSLRPFDEFTGKIVGLKELGITLQVVRSMDYSGIQW